MANLFKTELGKLFPALGQLHKAGVTDEMWEMIGDSDGEFARTVYKALLANMKVTSYDFEPIIIPADATAEGLVSEAEAELERAGIPFTLFDKDLLHLVRQDLELVRGRACKVLIHNFDRDWEISEGRNFQKAQGFDGNAAAFLVWVTKTKPMGWSVSIPNNDERLFRLSVDSLYAPFFYRVDVGCEFGLVGVWLSWSGWRGLSSLVAFSAI